MDGWMDEWRDGWIDGWMDEWRDGWIDGWMDEWRDGWIDGWMDGWIDGWMDRWMDRYNVVHSHTPDCSLMRSKKSCISFIKRKIPYYHSNMSHSDTLHTVM